MSTTKNFKAAADQVRGLAKSYRAVLEIAEILDHVGEIQQTEQELQVKLDATKAFVGAEEKALVAIKGRVATADAAAKEAEKAAAAITAKAQADAAKILEAANAGAAAVTKQARERVAEIELDGVRLVEQLEAMKKSKAAAEQELTALKGKVDALKADARKLLA